LVRRHAALEQRLTGAAIAVSVGGEEVDPGEAVDLQVDEARRSDTVAVRGAESDAGDASVDNLDVAWHQTPRD
jgi:hypothetical protein